MKYSTPNDIRYGTYSENYKGLAFQMAVGALELWPDDVPFSEFAAKLIREGSWEMAETIRLLELAKF